MIENDQQSTVNCQSHICNFNVTEMTLCEEKAT